MKKIATLCCTLLLTASFTTPVLAANPVKTDMKAMSQSLRAAAQADDAAAMKASLVKLRDYAAHARDQVPDDLQEQAADSPARKTYTEGMNKLLQQIDDAIGQLDAGKLDEAKATLDAIKQTRSEYHGKLKV